MSLMNFDDDNAIVSANPTSQQPTQVPVIHVTDPKYQGVTVDTRWTPRGTLLEHVSGFAWTVDYLSQVLGTDSSLGGFRPSSNPIHQQYTKIEALVMRVTQPLQAAQNPDTKVMGYQGKAVVGGFMIPNDGDCFIADIGTGASAYFKVLSTSKLAALKEAMYEITYEVGTDDAEFLAALLEKVVRTLVYRGELLTMNSNPLIISSLDALLDEAQNVQQAVLNQYFTRFFDNNLRTLLVPGQAKKVYDPYLTGFMTQLITHEDTLFMSRMKVLNVQEDPVYLQNNLWAALLEQDETLLDGGFTRAGLVEAYKFHHNPLFSGIRFSNADYTVYPINPTLGLNGVTEEGLKLISETELEPSTGGDVSMFEDTNTGALPDNSAIPGLYRVTFDDRYVLSQNFYGKTNSQSVLEQQVRKYLKRQTLDLEALIKTAKAFSNWGVLEQFYYVPLLLTLIRCGKFSA